VGETHDVLVDAASRRRSWELSGRTSGNTVVNVPGQADWIGRTVPVTIRRAGPNSVWGEAVVSVAGPNSAAVVGPNASTVAGPNFSSADRVSVVGPSANRPEREP